MKRKLYPYPTMQQLENKMSQEMLPFNFEITSLKEAMEYSKLISDSDLAPKDYKGKPGNVLIAIQYGNEVGLKPLQAIQNIAIINGRPTIWGDAMLGLVQNHYLCEYIREEFKTDTAYCTVKRRGEEEYTYKFSKADAKKAGLLGKAGPWQLYEERMLQMRARAFALRDKFADVLKGIAMREEILDYQEIESHTKEEKIQKGNEIVSALIEDKYTVESTENAEVNSIICIIENALTMEELKSIPSLVESVPEYKKEEIRKLYKEKRAEIKTKEKVEKVSHDLSYILERIACSSTIEDLQEIYKDAAGLPEKDYYSVTKAFEERQDFIMLINVK